MSPAAVFPVLSFLLAGLLAVLLILTLLWRRVPTTGTTNTVYTNTSYRTAIIALALWLLLGNAVHAVNALIWASTDAVHVPVWCDIVTRLLLGTTMALPGACLSLAVALRSSQRKPHAPSRRIHTLVDVALCYVLPLLYMVLHFAVQEHRFDLTLSLGCSASIHRSAAAAVVMIFPPLGVCVVALVVCLFSIYTAARARQVPPAPRSASTSTPSPSGLRLLAPTYTLLLTTTVLLATLLPLLSPLPQTSTNASFNRDFSSILIIRVPAEVSAARTAWWALPVVSIVFLLLAPLLLPSIFSRLRHPTRTRKQGRPELRRLTLSFQHEMLSKSSLLMTPAPTAPSPVQLQLRSGWDGMLDDVKTRTPAASSRRPGLGVGLGFLINPHASRKSVISAAYSDYDEAEKAGRASSDEEEEAFTSSTLSYLASPVAQALGLESPVGHGSAGSIDRNPPRAHLPPALAPRFAPHRPAPPRAHGRTLPSPAKATDPGRRDVDDLGVVALGRGVAPPAGVAGDASADEDVGVVAYAWAGRVYAVAYTLAVPHAYVSFGSTVAHRISVSLAHTLPHAISYTHAHQYRSVTLVVLAHAYTLAVVAFALNHPHRTASPPDCAPPRLTFIIPVSAFSANNSEYEYECGGGDEEKRRASTGLDEDEKEEEEEKFTSATLSYLASPVAQALGLGSPVGSATFGAARTTIGYAVAHRIISYAVADVNADVGIGRTLAHGISYAGAHTVAHPYTLAVAFAFALNHPHRTASPPAPAPDLRSPPPRHRSSKIFPCEAHFSLPPLWVSGKFALAAQVEMPSNFSPAGVPN
ncbi:pheromone A receptor-domain-containing protein [Mycena filopes]|nr:pheromone A receptor-domain-containing protein [Mycena filopes]